MYPQRARIFGPPWAVVSRTLEGACACLGIWLCGATGFRAGEGADRLQLGWAAPEFPRPQAIISGVGCCSSPRDGEGFILSSLFSLHPSCSFFRKLGERSPCIKLQIEMHFFVYSYLHFMSLVLISWERLSELYFVALCGLCDWIGLVIYGLRWSMCGVYVRSSKIRFCGRYMYCAPPRKIMNENCWWIEVRGTTSQQMVQLYQNARGFFFSVSGPLSGESDLQ